MKINKTLMIILICIGVFILGIVITGFVTNWKFFRGNITKKNTKVNDNIPIPKVNDNIPIPKVNDIKKITKKVNDNITKIKNVTDKSPYRTSENDLTKQVNSIVKELRREQKVSDTKQKEIHTKQKEIHTKQKEIDTKQKEIKDRVQNINDGKDVLKLFNITHNNMKSGIQQLLDTITTPKEICIHNPLTLKHQSFPEKNKSADNATRLSFFNSNKCADPDGSGRRWCYTKNDDRRWQWCDDNTDENVDINDGKAKTIDGDTCQRWDCKHKNLTG